MAGRSFIFLASALAIFLTPPARAGMISGLGFLAGDNWSEAVGINDAGVIVGDSELTTNHVYPATYHAVRWTDPLTIQSLGGSQSRSIAYGINASGKIAGENVGPSTWIDPGPMQNIAMPVGYTNSGSVASAINASGVLAVSADYWGTTPHAFRYANNVLQDLGLPGTAMYSQATAISDDGTIVGTLSYTNGNHRAFYAPPGGVAVVINANTTSAVAMNNTGMIAGATSTGIYRGTIAGAVTPLANTNVNGVDFDSIYGMNVAGVIVGTQVSFANAGPGNRALLWKPDNSVVNLDTWLDQVDPVDGANWTLQFAKAINNKGLVVGYGDYEDGAGGLADGQRGFVLDASSLIPEPSGLALLLPMVIFALSRQRNKTASPW